jgi:hypothetical protein
LQRTVEQTPFPSSGYPIPGDTRAGAPLESDNGFSKFTTTKRLHPKEQTTVGRALSSDRSSAPVPKGSFSPIGPGTVPVGNRESYTTQSRFGLSRINVLQCRKTCTGQQKALPFLPFGSFEKAFLFRFAEEAGTYVTTATRRGNSETADEL